MKNLWIIPADKPSRLRVGNNENFVFGIMQSAIQSRNDDFINQHIYITNDEEIKEGDKSLLFIDGFEPMILTHFEPIEEGYQGKKIILTTNQNLINDGIEQISEDTLLKIVEHINSGKNIESFDEL